MEHWNATQPAPSPGFEPFDRLPPDIRQKIWSVASSSPTSTPGVCIFAETYNKDEKEPHLVVHEVRNRALLQTNTAAQDMALVSNTGPTRN
jgi:hypothetical protein